MRIALVMALVISIERFVTMNITTNITALRWAVSVDGQSAFPPNVVILAMWQ